MQFKNSNIWIVDFGSQYTQLITRKFRELGYKSEILTVEEAFSRTKESILPKAFVLSGGPQSAFEDKTDYFDFFESQVPVLGICYGMQIMAKYHGGKIEMGEIGEYGKTQIIGEDGTRSVWMSHSDHVVKLPMWFKATHKTGNGLIASMVHKNDRMMGLQFHPEVEHTENGKDFLQSFCNMAGLKPDWDSQEMVHLCEDEIKKAEGEKILCAFSGGVDSLVAAALTQKTLGSDNLYCFFVDNGLLRPQDLFHINTLQQQTKLKIEIIDAKEEFLSRLSGVKEPEKKRKIIGHTFIDIFERKVHEYEKSHNIKFTQLLQGTLYPDVIESISPHDKDGKSVTIKSHHNVGGLPEKMGLKLLEPFKFLFKDEVREIGSILNLENDWVHRHPFPGPGLGVRILGELTEASIKKVQESDQILFEEMKNTGEYSNSWQAFTVLLPVKTVGVKGDYRAYEEVICVRMVNSTDGMTATWTRAPYEFLDKVSNRITNEVSGVTRVVYDITSKPPGTIEWE